MAGYANFNINKTHKRRKGLIAAACAAAIVLAALYIIGITVGKDSGGMERISAAVEENTRLKTEVSELEAEIARLQGEVDDLKAQLAARPTIAPAYTEPPEATDPPAYEEISPRAGLDDYDDDDYD